MIVTFYSYKGGLGRSMAVANVAVLLARDGYRVIVVDWDLEAPGLHRFFNLADQDLAGPEVRGVIEYVLDFKAAHEVEPQSDLSILSNLDEYLLPLSADLNLPEKTLRFMPAGRQDETYADRISSFDWDNFYNHWGGGRAIEYLKQELLKRAEYILVDSRTGLTDIGGICTKQLPSVLVLVVGSNWQSVDGVLGVIESLKTLDNPPKVLPLPSRIDKVGEHDLLQDWLQLYPEIFSVPSEIADPQNYFDRVMVPYQTRYSYGEELAVLKEEFIARGSVPDAYQQLKNYIQQLNPRESLKSRIAAAYRKTGALKIELDAKLADNLIDVYVEMKPAERGLQRIAVEVKDWDRAVGVAVIREFGLAIENLHSAGLVDEGVVVSAAGFSKQARGAAQTYGIHLQEPSDFGIESRVTEISKGATVKALERRVADAYRAVGARKVEHDVELGGNQIDVYVEMVSADRSIHRIAVEVKDWLQPVGIAVINEFALVVENLRRARLVDEGVIVSVSGFSRQARNVAQSHGIRLLELADLGAMAVGPTLRDVEESMRPHLEFADREAELRWLMGPINNPGAPRYVQVYAPGGLGKTYLLKQAQTEYEAAGWLCAWLGFTNVSLCLQTELILEQLGEQFGAGANKIHTSMTLAQQIMRAKKQSVIFLDAVDLASGEVRRWIKTDLITNLEDRIPDLKLRPYFIAAGRYPIREWTVYSMQRFELIRLTPFNDTVVDDLLRRFAGKAAYELSDDFFQRMTEAILFITKGHPACITRVLQEIRGRNFAISALELTQASTFNHTVGDLLDEDILVRHVSERSREVFKTLCVLRGYTSNFLDRLARDGWVPARERIDWNLESELLTTYLIETPDGSPLYRLEPLIRQLVALQMEYNEEDKFLELNRTALEIFEEQVKGKDKKGNELPSRPCDRMQVALAVEALYHQAVLLRQDEADRNRARSKLLDKVSEYLSYRLTHESDDYWVSLLLSVIEKDRELTALVYELTGAGGLEFVLQPLYDLLEVQEG